MDYRSVVKFLAFIMLFIVLVMLVPFLIAVSSAEHMAAMAFLKTMILMMSVSFASIVLTWKTKGLKIGTKEATLVVSLTWIIMTLFGALPLYLSGSVHTYARAFFEIMSGFTTAGATVLDDIESLGRSVLFWRSLTNWLGGMGVVVLFVAVLPIFGVKGNALVGAEAVGPAKSKLTPTIRGTATALYLIYFGLTAAEAVLLRIGGLDWFNALTVTFGTIGAAGFAPLNVSIAGYESSFVEWVCTVFMLLSGINFSLYFYIIRGQIRKVSSNAELRLYLSLIGIVSLLVSLQLFFRGVYSTFSEALREGLFHVVSMITTTGFVADEFNAWPMFSQMLLILVCFVGACSGSAGGGIKVIRVGVLLRLSYNSILRRVHPNSVSPVSFGSDYIDNNTVLSIAGYIGCYFATLFIGSAIIGLTDRDFLTCFASVFLCLGNLGTGIGGMGSGFSFSVFPDWSLWVFSFLMLVGRLEFYTVYTLFSKAYWRS